MKSTLPKRKLFLRLLAGLVIVGTGVVLAAAGYQIFQQVGMGQIPVLNPFQSNTAIPPDNTPIPSPTATPLIPVPEWDGSSRVTMLLIGLDYRDWEASGDASRSDTMILLSVDPATKTAGIVSIPRDLWAAIPGFIPHKINMAYYFGESNKLPGGGPGLAMKTIEQVLGIPIDYYAVVDFDAFVNFIDLIGGVKLKIPEEIKVFVIQDGVGKTKRIESGWQVLTGELALGYARARHTEGGDFDRAVRQQQVIMGIRNRILEPGRFQDMLRSAPRIYAELSAGVITNLPFEDALKLAGLATQVKRKDIRRGMINEKYVTFGRSPAGLAILIPIPDKIRELRNEIFSESGPFTPYSQGSPQELIKQEDAFIALVNGTASQELVTKTAQYLTDLGFTVVEKSQSGAAAAQTRITDHSGNPFTLQYLLEVMQVNPRYLYHDFIPNSLYDIEIVLGSDWFYNNPMP